MSHNTFDRVRPRAEPAGGAPVDTQGKSALFSRAPVTPSLGSVAITCSDCRSATVVPYHRALLLAVPSLHLPVVRRDYPSWMLCPACSHRRWVRIRFR